LQNDEDITINKKQSNNEFATVMRALIWRYISMKPREMESVGVTEDDVNEIKSELSTMKYDFLEVLRKNGMEVPSDHRKKTSKTRFNDNILDIVSYYFEIIRKHYMP